MLPVLRSLLVFSPCTQGLMLLMHGILLFIFKWVSWKLIWVGFPQNGGKYIQQIQAKWQAQYIQNQNTENVDKRHPHHTCWPKKSQISQGLGVDFNNHTRGCLKLWYDMNGNAGTRLACVISGLSCWWNQILRMKDGWRWSVLRRRGWRVCKSAKFHQDIMSWPNEGQFDVFYGMGFIQKCAF